PSWRMTIGFAMVRDAPAAVCFTSGATTHTSSLSWRAAATRRARPGASIPSSLEINIRIRLPSRHGYAVSGAQFGAQSWNMRLERHEIFRTAGMAHRHRTTGLLPYGDVTGQRGMCRHPDPVRATFGMKPRAGRVGRQVAGEQNRIVLRSRQRQQAGGRARLA